MEDKNKHNIFSKEEFFKAIDEKKSLPPEADEFDKEALEGLSMVKDRQKLEKLDASIDEIVRREKAIAGRKKNMYYFAAAASLALIIGIFFLVKETTLKKDEMAQSAPEKTEEVVNGKDQAAQAAQEMIEGGEDKKAPAIETPQPKAKEGSFKEGKLEEESAKGETFANSVTTVNVPAESENRTALNEKSNGNGWAGGADASGKREDNRSGAKSTVDEVTLADQEQSRGVKDQSVQKPDEKKKAEKKADELSKNLESERKLYKEADEKEKRRYETNTVWTSTPAANGPESLKQQQTKTEAKPQVAADDRAVAGTTSTSNAAPVQMQAGAGDVSKADKNNNVSTGEEQVKNPEVAVTNRSRGNSGAKHRKLKTKTAAEPAPSGNQDKDVTGYSYYSQTSTRDFTSPEFIGGKEALQQFISNNLEVSAPEKKGTVVAEFTVKSDGAVDTSNVKITQPIKGCDPCSKDVKDLVKKMPKWQPALENGKGKEYRQKVSVPYRSRQVKK